MVLRHNFVLSLNLCCDKLILTKISDYVSFLFADEPVFLLGGELMARPVVLTPEKLHLIIELWRLSV